MLTYCDLSWLEWHKIFTSNLGVASESWLKTPRYVNFQSAPLSCTRSVSARRLEPLSEKDSESSISVLHAVYKCGVPTFRNSMNLLSGLEVELLNLDWKDSCRKPEWAEWRRCFWLLNFSSCCFWTHHQREESLILKNEGYRVMHLASQICRV